MEFRHFRIFVEVRPCSWGVIEGAVEEEGKEKVVVTLKRMLEEWSLEQLVEGMLG